MTMNNKASIAIELIFVASAILLALGICSCKKQNGEEQAQRPRDQKPAQKQEGQKLAQDLIAAGFIPLAVFKPSTGDQVYTESADNGSLAEYDNGYFSLDPQGRISGLLFNPHGNTRYPRGSTFILKTYQGSNLLLLTRQEVLRLYGTQKGIQEELDTMGGNSLGYVYRISNNAFVNVLIGFDGQGDSAKVSAIQAGYSSAPPEWASKITKLTSWPRAN